MSKVYKISVYKDPRNNNLSGSFGLPQFGKDGKQYFLRGSTTISSTALKRYDGGEVPYIIAKAEELFIIQNDKEGKYQYIKEALAKIGLTLHSSNLAMLNPTTPAETKGKIFEIQHTNKTKKISFGEFLKQQPNRICVVEGILDNKGIFFSNNHDKYLSPEELIKIYNNSIDSKEEKENEDLEMKIQKIQKIQKKKAHQEEKENEDPEDPEEKKSF